MEEDPEKRGHADSGQGNLGGERNSRVTLSLFLGMYAVAGSKAMRRRSPGWGSSDGCRGEDVTPGSPKNGRTAPSPLDSPWRVLRRSPGGRSATHLPMHPHAFLACLLSVFLPHFLPSSLSCSLPPFHFSSCLSSFLPETFQGGASTDTSDQVCYISGLLSFALAGTCARRRLFRIFKNSRFDIICSPVKNTN